MKLQTSSAMLGRRAALARVTLRLMAAGRSTYQPVSEGGRLISTGERATEHRLAVVMAAADRVGAQTVLDLGCAEGFIVRRCAEAGRLSYGVDIDVWRLALAQWSLTLDGVEGFGLIRSDITLDTLPRFPSADVVVCLSVLHHVMYEHGFDYALSMLELIRRLTQATLVFEMGQSDEQEFVWARELPDMGSDPHSWVAEFLESAGFRDVQKVAEVPSYVGSVSRAIFTAAP